MNIHLTMKSRNVKTGKIPVSTSSAKTCPDSCPFKKNGCYADSGPLLMFWRKVTEGFAGDSFKGFCKTVSQLPANQFWRHNQAGDMYGSKGRINATKARQLVKANHGKRGFTYTHYDTLLNKHNRAIVKWCNEQKFTVNLSANNLEHADSLAELGVAPVVAVLPHDADSATVTPQGRRVIVCPAIASDSITCKSCQLCQRQDRKVIVGFPAHGTSKRKASLIAEGSHV